MDGQKKWHIEVGAPPKNTKIMISENAVDVIMSGLLLIVSYKESGVDGVYLEIYCLC